jgi:lipopolysaccharide export system permease protein
MHETNAALHEAAYVIRMFEVQRQKIPANALACIAMFLIGAPLGTLIRRGGLGVPFLVSIFFFIIYTLLGMQGEDLALQALVSIAAGVWTANIVLLLIGLHFLYIAQHDGRLFEGDTYRLDWRRFFNRGMAAMRRTV